MCKTSPTRVFFFIQTLRWLGHEKKKIRKKEP